MRILVFLMAFVPCFLQAQTLLKAGTYHNLKSDKPIVLKKGSFSFIGLQMNRIASSTAFRGSWIDGHKADTVRFFDCLFSGIEKGTVLKLSGVVKIENCVFEAVPFKIESLKRKESQMNSIKTGIEYQQGSSIAVSNSTLKNLNYGIVFYGTTQGSAINNIKENTFDNNQHSLLFKSSYKASYQVNFNCNRFNYTSAAPFTKRYGIYVENGANMPNIGGTGANGVDYPSGNWWPRNPSTDPQVTNWSSPTDWITIRNGSANNWTYFRYKNEFVGENGISILNNLGSGISLVNQATNFIVSNLNNPTLTNTYLGSTLRQDCFNFGAAPVFPTRQAVDVAEELKAKTEPAKSAYLLDPVPNPANRSTHIGFVLDPNAHNSFIELFEIATGKLQKRMGITIGKEGTLEIGLHALPSGIYGCRLVSDGALVDWKRISIVH
jgi:hypothetical protein